MELMLLNGLFHTAFGESLEVTPADSSSTPASVLPTSNSTVISNDALSSTERSTKGPPAQTFPPRIYLQKGNLQDGYLAGNVYPNQRDDYKPQPYAPNRIQTSLQIYIIFFIGIMPAAIAAFGWWVKNISTNCLGSNDKRQSSSNQDVERLSHRLMKGDKNKMSIDNLAHQIARRAEKMTIDENGQANNSYRSKLIKSRRVYSMEIPRKYLEMVEILGEGNFGQVWKAKSYQTQDGGKSKPLTVAVKTNKG